MMDNVLSLENLEMPDLTRKNIDVSAHILPAGNHIIEKRIVKYLCECVPFPLEGVSAGKWRAKQFEILCRIFGVSSRREAGQRWMSYGPWHAELVGLLVDDAHEHGYADWLPEEAMRVYADRYGVTE